MIVKTNDGVFRVQFVHSAHDLKQSRALASPGGLRQIVDNLAASMRRRVTLAEISRVENVFNVSAEPVRSYVPIAQGFAICHFTDQFVKQDGRDRSLLKALSLSGLPRDTREDIAVEVTGHTVAGLREIYRYKDDSAHAVLNVNYRSESPLCSCSECDC